MRGLEVRSLFGALNRLLAFDEFQRVLLVRGELLQRLVVAHLRWIRGLESLVVEGLVRLNVLLRGNLLLLFGQRDICAKDFLDWVERVLLTGYLRESFLLNLRFMLKTFLCENHALGVKRIGHVRKVASEAGLLTNLTYLWWIS
jgi:hypothetical protein